MRLRFRSATNRKQATKLISATSIKMAGAMSSATSTFQRGPRLALSTTRPSAARVVARRQV